MTTMIQTLPALPAPVAPARPRLLTGAVLRLFAVDFAAMSSFYLLLSVVPLYSADSGIGSVGAGLSTGVLMFASVGAEMATPGLAARLGYRRLLMGGLVLLGAPALALPAVTGLVALMAVSVVRGVGFAIVVVAVGALTATAIPEQRRGEGLGALGVVAMLPAVVNLPLGVWLVGRFGYLVVFIVAAAVALLAVVLVGQLPEGVSEADHQGGGLAAILRRPAVLGPTLVFAATAVAGGAVVAFLPGAVTGSVAVPALFVQSASATLTRWLAGRHSDRHGAAGLLVPAVVVSALGMGAAAFTGNSVAVVAGMAVFGAGFGVAQSASMNTMLQRVSRSQYGAVSAAWNGAYDLGWGAGAIGIGMVVAGAGCSAAFAAAALLVLAALPLARRNRD
ncbi:MAG TPA: MFS transporter [Streptosporangiaceae bacterium]|jgi:predicted MFS family arabinose efflux permease